MNFQPRGSSRRPMREARDTRKPLYFFFVLDTSSSMAEEIPIMGEEGTTERVRKIDELNRGLAAALNSMRRFEANNVLYKVYYQIIELNSYGKALFPDFVPLSVQSEEVCFSAMGVTCLENSIATLKEFMDPKYLPGCNRAINVILMSDGYPTDVEGYVVDKTVYTKTIDDFSAFLEKRGFRANVDLYAIGVGNNVCEDMLKTFAGEGKYYKVEDMESLAEKLDFVTRNSLKRHSTRPMRSSDSGTGGSAVEEEIRVREIDVTRCLKETCLACIDSCALSAIQYSNGLVSISSELCVGCGSCEEHCPCNAITVGESGNMEGLIS